RLRRRAPHRSFVRRVVAAVAAYGLMVLVIVGREAAAFVATEAVQQELVCRPFAATEYSKRDGDAEHAADVTSVLPVMERPDSLRPREIGARESCVEEVTAPPTATPAPLA